MKTLVVDDAAEVIEAVTVSFTLQWRETEVIGADNGEAALDLVEQEHPNVVLLDIAMPGMNGFEVLREIRAFSDVPIIMLTAKDAVLDKVKGLEFGADDYVTKPFDHLELLARVKALLRRLDMPQPTSRAPSFHSGDLTVDFATREMRLRGKVGHSPRRSTSCSTTSSAMPGTCCATRRSWRRCGVASTSTRSIISVSISVACAESWNRIQSDRSISSRNVASATAFTLRRSRPCSCAVYVRSGNRSGSLPTVEADSIRGSPRTAGTHGIGTIRRR